MEHSENQVDHLQVHVAYQAMMEAENVFSKALSKAFGIRAVEHRYELDKRAAWPKAVHESFVRRQELIEAYRAASAAIKPLEAIWHRLSLRGWNTITVMGATCAEKEFQTAVGPKFANAYIEGQIIRGVYESEGRNVLANHCKLLTPDWQSELTDKDLDAIERFCKDADRAIGDSYAVRLLH